MTLIVKSLVQTYIDTIISNTVGDRGSRDDRSRGRTNYHFLLVIFWNRASISNGFRCDAVYTGLELPSYL